MSLDLSFPRRPYVELYLDGAWRNVVGDVRQSSLIKIERGRKNEASKPAPGKCLFALDDGPGHGNGDYSPRNPLGQWYGHLGRNAPVRVGLAGGSDQFERDVVDGWGSSPRNGLWTTATGGGGGTSAVSGGTGRHVISVGSAWVMNYLSGVRVRDVDVSVSVSFDQGEIHGAAVEPANIVLRGQTVDDYYLVRMEMNTDQSVSLRIMIGGGVTVAGPLTLDTGYFGEQWRVRSAIEQGHIMAKAWRAGEPEPLGWQIDTVRPTPFGAGWIGIRSGVASGNTDVPIVVQYTDLEIRVPRFAGEVSKLVPTTNLTHTERSVQVECGGLLRRIQKYDKTLAPPVRRYIDRAVAGEGIITPVEYWPLDEPATATTPGASALGGHPARFTRGVGSLGEPIGTIKWGVDAGLPSLVGAVELTNGALLTLPVRAHTSLTTGWSVAWGQRLSADVGGRVWLRTANPDNDIYMIVYTDGTWEVYRTTSGIGGELLLSGVFPSSGFDDTWHTIALSCHDIGGGQAGYSMSLDGVLDGTASGVDTWSPLTRVELFVDPGADPGAYGHVVVFGEDIDTVTADFAGYHNQFFGRPGDPAFGGRETGAGRFVRLCTEEGIPHSWTGTLDDSPLMGAQTPITIGALLAESVTVDQGTLYEPRSIPAMAIRTLTSTYAQSTVVTMDYAAGQIAPEFAPVEDDLDPVNDVTAKRTHGGQDARYEQTSGRMNVSDPGTAPGAVGRYDDSITVNVESDDQLLDAAAWRVHLGTVDEPRYPTITVDLAAAAVTAQPGLPAELLDLNVDDVLTVTNLAATLIADDVRQIARGYTEVFDTAYRHLLTVNTSPASPYDVADLDDTALRLDSDTSTLAADAVAGTDATMSVATAGGTVWTTDPAEFPFTVRAAGVVLEVTAITGTSSPQLFTVTTTPVNGVAKTIPAGTPVSLADPVYLAL